MKSYTQLRNLFGTLTNNSASSNLTLADELLNDNYRAIITERDWQFLEKSGTTVTAAGTQFYALPADYDRLINVTVTIGTNVYTPRECTSRIMWDRLNQSSLSSDYPEYFFVFNGQVGFYPKPASSSNTITFIYRKRVPDLSIADYVTGNVSALTTATSAVTGSGTTWTAPMIGRWIKITTTDTAGQSGDGMWYEISAVPSSTSITLSKEYGGATITGNTAYTIGQMSVLPEAHQELPLWRALKIYYTSVTPEPSRVVIYERMEKEGMQRLRDDYGNKTSSPVIDDGVRRQIVNPNLTVTTVG